MNYQQIKLNKIILIPFLLLVLGLSTAFAGIKTIRSNSLEDRVQIVLDLTNKAKFDFFSLANPNRIIVDVDSKYSKNYRNKLSFKNRGITKVRTGVRPDKTMRVVLDLKYNFKWKITQLMPEPSIGRGYRIVIDIYDNKVSDEQQVVKSVKKRPVNILLEPYEIPQKTPVVIVTPKKPVKVKPKATPKVITVSKPKNRPISSQKTIIVIDAGHGGKDPGSIGANKTKEKTVVLQIAKELQKEINKVKGMKAILTRSTDRYIPLRGRIRIAQKKKADLFVSIHADAFTKSNVRGSSVFILSNRGASSEAAKLLAKKENSVDFKYGISIGGYDSDITKVLVKIQQDATIESSYSLAKETLRKLKGIGSVHKRYVERAGFVVLKSPSIPSMLVETAFISNPAEEKKLKSKKYQRKLAKAITAGIVKYFDTHLPQHLLLIQNK